MRDENSHDDNSIPSQSSVPVGIPRPQASHAQRVLLVVWDGMRPDLVTDELTPHLRGLMARGAMYERAVGVFPSVTRPTTSSVSTGAYPAAHGVVSNLFIGPPGDRTPLDTGDRDALERLRAVNGRRILPLLTLAETVAAAGKRFVCMGSGSTGQIRLLDPEHAGVTIHTAFTHPEPLWATLAARFGPPPAKEIPVNAANDWLVDVLAGYVLPNLDPAVVVLWMCEPDASQHAQGLGSAEAIAAIRGNDARLGRILDAVNGSGVPTTVIVASDHGHSTVTGMVHTPTAFTDAGFGAALERGDLHIGEQAVTVEPHAEAGLREAIGAWLADQPWVGALIAWPDAGTSPARALPFATLTGNRERAAFSHAPTYAYSYAWTDVPNVHGIRGTSYSGFAGELADLTRLQGPIIGLDHLTSTHGTLSPRDQRTVLALGGAGIRPGALAIPAGVVDIAPTILALLGLPPLPDADGRALTEAFADGPAPASVGVRTESLPVQPSGPLRRHTVGTTAYLDTSAES